MDPTTPYLHALRQAIPDLPLGRARINLDGQNSTVLIAAVDDIPYVFRFPKYPHVIQQMQRETSLLLTIGPRLPLPIPQPQYVYLQAPPGQAFHGYPLLPGQPLWRADFRQISSPVTRAALATQLAGFLHALHAIPLEQAGLPTLTTPDTRQHYQDMYARIQAQLFPRMRPDARRSVAAHFEPFLSAPAGLAFAPVLVHGDFGASNLLYDLAEPRITGVIDFSSAGPGDPAGDFAGLLACYGEDFLRNGLPAYPALETFLPRVQFYCGTFALEEALFGLDHGDAQAFQAGMATYI